MTYDHKSHGACFTISDATAESFRRFKLDRAEERMKSALAAGLYGGGKPRVVTEAQKARAPGYYWTRYAGQEWTLDLWEHGCWSYAGSDEISHDDPSEIVGPVTPPVSEESA